MDWCLRSCRAAAWMAALLLLATPSLSIAQSIPQPVVMVIDTAKIMAEARAMNSIRDQIDQIRSSYQAEIKREEDELRRADQEMAQQRQVLSPEAFNQRRQELQQRASALQVKARTRRTQLDQALRDAVQVVRNRLLKIVETVAQRHGANVVVQKSDLVYADDRMEFTDEVLAQLNAELSTVTVETPRG